MIYLLLATLALTIFAWSRALERLDTAIGRAPSARTSWRLRRKYRAQRADLARALGRQR